MLLGLRIPIPPREDIKTLFRIPVFQLSYPRPFQEEKERQFQQGGEHASPVGDCMGRWP